ncbi:uncharacterized protein FFFS_14512 [Fusarium fujikuroi]|nr:uncharacterized protein FFFS_14512 [Fusarium fujikuroi]
MPNLLVRLKYADKFPDIFMVMQDEMNGFKRHNSCNTWVPVGMPVIDRPWNNAFLQSLLDHRRFHEGIADRMVAKVDMAIREHKRKTRKEEQKAQRAKAIKERRERAALKRSLARQEREETTKASGEKIRIRTRLASRFHVSD